MSAQLADHPLVGTIWDAATGRGVTAEALLAALGAARYRLLGEVHDNPDHHAIRLEWLRALGDRGLRPVVAFEQFDREHDEALQRRLAAGAADAEAVAAAVRFDREGWNWELYRPLVEAALRFRMPLRAANLSRAAVRRVVTEGLAALGGGRVAALRLDATWSGERERVLAGIIAEGHCNALPASLVPRMSAAQRARDATLAEALLDPGPEGAVLFAGNGHVRRDLAVPVYLAATRPGETVVSVGLLEVEAGESEPAAYLAGTAGEVAPYHFACFTPRWDRPDPCDRFKPPHG